MLTYSVSSFESRQKEPCLGWLDTVKCNMLSCECSFLRENPCLILSCQRFCHPSAWGRVGTQGSHVQQAPWSFGSGWSYSGGEDASEIYLFEKIKEWGHSPADGNEGSWRSLQNGPTMEPWGAPERLNIETEHQPLSRYRCNEAG